VTECFVAREVDPGTANKHIVSMQSYWRWMGKRTDLENNPWVGQSQAKGNGRNGETAKRPFTEAELRLLLTGDADQEMADAIRIALLSGMRLEESYQLRVADCVGDEFNIRRGKSKAAVRRVPIHSALAEIVARRVAGKAATAFLFHEPADGRGPRSGALSQRFVRYRIKLRVHEAEAGRRHSRVDFHSCRRWFVTQCRQGGIDRATVAAVVGYEVGNLTDDVYSGGPSLDQRRQCVESVRLPG
jgi:integrase